MFHSFHNFEIFFRVGRTARIGAKGSSLILVLPSEADFIKELENSNMPMVELTADRVLEKLYKNAETSKKTGKLPHTMEEAATDLQMNFENAIVNDKGLHELASQAYVSLIRSYASFPKEVRHIFSFKALHLGHIAKSFGLRDPPSHITGRSIILNNFLPIFSHKYFVLNLRYRAYGAV